MDNAAEFMTPEQVAAALQVSVSTLYQWKYKGVGPQVVKYGRHLRYPRAEFQTWKENLSR